MRPVEDGWTPWTALASQARRDPDRVAVRTHDGDLSYGALAAAVRSRAADVASLIKPGMIVTVPDEPSMELIVDIMAILACGAGFLPVPRDRSARSAAAFSYSHASLTADGCEVRLDVTVTAGRASRPVYCVMTSGSTGQPKTIAVAGGSLASYLSWAHGRWNLSGATVLTSSLCYDLSFTALLGPLCFGGTLHVPSEIDRRSYGWAERMSSLDWIKMTPSHAWLILREFPQARFSPTCVVGGEIFTAELAAELRRRDVVMLINEYGPAECTIGCVAGEVSTVHDGVAAVGRPITGVEAEILPTGELQISGAAVAVGYVARATAEGLDYSELFGGVFNTHDLCHALPGGELVVLGRTDRLVKISGVRISLDEIERALLATGLVVQARCEAGPGGRVTAVVVPVSTEPSLVDRLKAACRRQLPGHVYPHQFELVSTLGVTPSGKASLQYGRGARA